MTYFAIIKPVPELDLVIIPGTTFGPFIALIEPEMKKNGRR